MNAQDPVQLDAFATRNLSSPLSPAGLFRLFLMPREFFANIDLVGHRPEVVFAALAMGVTGSMGQIDKKIMQAELGQANKSLELLAWLLSSWINYWIVVLAAGAVGAVVLWLIGGWWYRKRLQWSGASDASPTAARRINAYQELVFSGPAVLIVLVQTLLFANYQEAWQADEVWSSSILVFVFWSCWTSYAAATTVFPVVKRKAMLWFLILPVLFYIVTLGIVGSLYALFGGHAA